MAVESTSIKMTSEHINPISVAKALVNIMKAEFSHRKTDETPNFAEIQVAETLFEKFAKITTDYTFIDEFENDFGQSYTQNEKVNLQIHSFSIVP